MTSSKQIRPDFLFIIIGNIYIFFTFVIIIIKLLPEFSTKFIIIYEIINLRFFRAQLFSCFLLQ